MKEPEKPQHGGKFFRRISRNAQAPNAIALVIPTNPGRSRQSYTTFFAAAAEFLFLGKSASSVKSNLMVKV
jgi:hypothetical protein